MTAADYAWSFAELSQRLVRTAGQEGVPEDCVVDLGEFCRDPGVKGIEALNAVFAKARQLIRR